MHKISIIMPAYNEEKRIGKTLERYSAYFEKLKEDKKLDYEILVVINNTTDRTEEIVKEHQRKNRNIRYLNFKPGGKGFAILEGFKDALKRDMDMIGFVDADMSTLPEDYYDLVRRIGDSGGAIASRYIEGGVMNPKPTIQRIIAKRMFNILTRVLLFLPYKDTQCGAKLFKREVIVAALPHLAMTKWAFDVDLIYTIRKRGFRVREIPTTWSDREYAKIDFWQTGPWMALGIVRLRLLNSPARSFIRIYDKLLNKIWRLK